MDFWDAVRELVRAQDTKIEAVAKGAGISLETFNGWIYKKRLPRLDEAAQIARTSSRRRISRTFTTRRRARARYSPLRGEAIARVVRFRAVSCAPSRFRGVSKASGAHRGTGFGQHASRNEMPPPGLEPEPSGLPPFRAFRSGLLGCSPPAAGDGSHPPAISGRLASPRRMVDTAGGRGRDFIESARSRERAPRAPRRQLARSSARGRASGPRRT